MSDTEFGQIFLQIFENILRGQRRMITSAAWLDGDDCLRLTRIADTVGRRDRGTAQVGTNLQNMSRAYLREMIDQGKHIQMQHRVFAPHFLQLAVNRMTSVFRQGLHQCETVFQSWVHKVIGSLFVPAVYSGGE